MKLNSKIRLGFSIAAGVLVVTTVASLLSIRALGVQTRRVQHTYEVLQHAQAVTSSLKDAQAGVRGYQLTGDSIYLQPYYRARAELAPGLRQMSELTVDNPAQQQRLDSLRALVALELRTLSPLVRTQTAFSQPMLHTLLDTDRQTMQRIQQVQRRIKNHETTLLAQRSQQQDLYETTTPVLVVASAALATIIVIWLLVQIARELSDNRRLQGELALTYSHTARRIELIKDLADRVVQGDYAVKIPDSGRDNLGELATALNHMTQTLDQVFGALEKRNKELDQFAYVASHDLKAPLRGVTTIVKWIEDELAAEISPQLRIYLDQMKGRLVRLEDLINGLLAYARVGRTARTVEEVAVPRLLAEVAELVVPTTFGLELAPNLPTLRTDRLSLQQVFTNLLGNAVKYHDRGNGHLRVSCQDLGPTYEFRVEDDGPGIAPEYRDKVFLLFQTLRDRHTAESTGIGLSIVKKIIDEQKGSIRIEGGLHGRGAAFVFTWPKEL